MLKKHAFLIGAYKNQEYLSDFVESLRGPRSNIYIHINPLNVVDFKEFIECYKHDSRIKIIHSVPVKWGGSSLLKSMLALLNLAADDDENVFFHMLTGQDILIKPLETLYDFFDEHSSENFLEYGENLKDRNDKGYLLGINRSQYYHLFDKLNYRSNIIHRQIEKYFVKAQQFLHIKRKWPFPNYYQGSGWFSLNRKGACTIVDYFKENIKLAENTFAPDEVFFQSILLNAKEDMNVVNDNLRYIRWTNPDEVGSPDVLTEKNFEEMCKTRCFFARKIEPRVSQKLIQMIKFSLKR